MRPFLRIARGVLRYPLGLAMSILCSLAVALLWGGNIGAVYPLLEVCLRGQTVQTWIQEEIEDANQEKLTLASELEDREKRLSATQRNITLKKIDALDTSIRRHELILPYAERLPGDPFHTVALFVGILLIASALKNFFLVGNLTATASVAQRTGYRGKGWMRRPR